MNAFTRSHGRSTATTLRRVLPWAAACVGLTLSAQASARESSLPPNGVLLVGQRLVDPNCYYHLDMQADANLVLYAGIGTAHPIWANNESGNIGGYKGNDPNQAYVSMQTDGNFVEYVPAEFSDFTTRAIWASNTNTGRQNVLEMQVDGNVVVYPAGAVQWAGTALWSSQTSGAIHPTPPGNACNDLSGYTVFHDHTMMTAGIIYGNATTDTWTACGELCVQSVGCTAFEYALYGVSQKPADCTLFTGAPTLAPNQEFDSIVGTITNSY